ncbi:chromosome partitioning protein ParB [Oribacterium sp. C9]|uniref:ParB/RepB/Spo0J family partition protein n=1 Tax=Oribacterium sp. C9 TaxID=1943579 RepID=UPI00098F49B5|nr:ParB/RepB/Spo0J family partition protein [Oribacterium sp. C9]OON87414.1 chromosome partitioning protein ParB [Oribacterium sp. C9]
MAANRPRIHFESVEELLGVPQMQDGTELVKIKDIFPFKDHPFKVLDDEKMDELVESIRTNGVLTPVLIRPRSEGGYEMVSGHRRLHAAEKAGLEKIPSIIKEMGDDEAVIAMVDSNVQREEILPSERAWSLKMKMEAVTKQGKRTDLVESSTSRTQCEKLSADEVGETMGLKARQVQKYIRLTELIPELLQMVDDKKLTISMAVDMSYFNEEVQGWMLDYIITNGKITLKQMAALKELENVANITKYTFTATLNGALPEGKGNGRVNLSERKLNKYFPPRMTARERERIIIELLEKWKAEKEQ